MPDCERRLVEGRDFAPIAERRLAEPPIPNVTEAGGEKLDAAFGRFPRAIERIELLVDAPFVELRT